MGGIVACGGEDPALKYASLERNLKAGAVIDRRPSSTHHSPLPFNCTVQEYLRGYTPEKYYKREVTREMKETFDVLEIDYVSSTLRTRVPVCMCVCQPAACVSVSLLPFLPSCTSLDTHSRHPFAIATSLHHLYRSGSWLAVFPTLCQDRR